MSLVGSLNIERKFDGTWGEAERSYVNPKSLPTKVLIQSEQCKDALQGAITHRVPVAETMDAVATFGTSPVALDKKLIETTKRSTCQCTSKGQLTSCTFRNLRKFITDGVEMLKIREATEADIVKDMELPKAQEAAMANSSSKEGITLAINGEEVPIYRNDESERIFNENYPIASSVPMARYGNSWVTYVKGQLIEKEIGRADLNVAAVLVALNESAIDTATELTSWQRKAISLVSEGRGIMNSNKRYKITQRTGFDRCSLAVTVRDIIETMADAAKTDGAIGIKSSDIELLFDESCFVTESLSQVKPPKVFIEKLAKKVGLCNSLARLCTKGFTIVDRKFPEEQSTEKHNKKHLAVLGVYARKFKAPRQPLTQEEEQLFKLDYYQFWATQADFYGLLSTCLRNQREGTVCYVKPWTSDSVVIVSVHYMPGADASVKWAVLTKTGELEKGKYVVKCTMFGYQSQQFVQSKLAIAHEMMGIVALTNPNAIAFHLCNILAINPAQPMFDCAELSYYWTTDMYTTVAAASPTAYIMKCLKFLKEKQCTGKPSGYLGWLQFEIYTNLAFFSSPSTMFIEKGLTPPKKKTLFSYAECWNKHCQHMLLYDRGKYTTDEKEATAFLNYMLKKLDNKEFSQNAIKRINDAAMSVSGAVTPNTSAMAYGTGVKGTACVAAMCSILHEAFEQNGLSYPGDKALLTVADHLASLYPNIEYMFAKNQAIGSRPITVFTPNTRVALHAINQVTLSLFGDEPCDGCCNPLNKDKNIKKMAERLNQAYSAQRSSIVLTLDMKAFGVSFNYPLTIKAMVQAAGLAFGHDSAVKGIYEKLLNSLATRYAYVPFANLDELLGKKQCSYGTYMTVNQTGFYWKHWKRVNFAFEYLCLKCYDFDLLKVDGTEIKNINPLTSDVLFGDRIKVSPKKQIPSWNPSTEALENIEYNEGKGIYYKFENGTDEGQLMYPESVTFTWLLRYWASQYIKLPEADFIHEVTSDDVVMTIILPKCNDEWTTQSMTNVVNDLMRSLKYFLSKFHVQLSEQKCTYNLFPYGDTRSKTIVFNSNIFSLSADNLGQRCNHYFRMIRPINSFKMFVSPVAQANNMISSLKQLASDFRVPTEFCERCVQVCRALSPVRRLWTLYLGSWKKMPNYVRDSVLCRGIPLVENLEDLWQDWFCLEFVKYNTHILPLFEPDSNGILMPCLGSAVLSSKAKQVKIRMTELADRLEHYRNFLNIDIDIYKTLLRQIDAEDSTTDYFWVYAKCIFSSNYKNGIPITAIHNSPIRLDGAKPLYMQIIDGKVKPNSHSRFYRFVYKGHYNAGPNLKSPLEVKNCLETLTGDAIKTTEQATLDILSMCEDIKATPKMHVVFVEREGIMFPGTLDSWYNDPPIGKSLFECIDKFKCPTALVMYDPIGITVAYSEAANGDVLFGRDGYLTSIYNFPSKTWRIPVREDQLLHRVLFSDVLPSIDLSSAITRTFLTDVSMTEYTWCYHKKGLDSRVYYIKQETTESMIKNFGTLRVQRVPINDSLTEPHTLRKVWARAFYPIKYMEKIASQEAKTKIEIIAKERVSLAEDLVKNAIKLGMTSSVPTENILNFIKEGTDLKVETNTTQLTLIRGDKSYDLKSPYLVQRYELKHPNDSTDIKDTLATIKAKLLLGVQPKVIKDDSPDNEKRARELQEKWKQLAEKYNQRILELAQMETEEERKLSTQHIEEVAKVKAEVYERDNIRRPKKQRSSLQSSIIMVPVIDNVNIKPISLICIYKTWKIRIKLSDGGQKDYRFDRGSLHTVLKQITTDFSLKETRPHQLENWEALILKEVGQPYG